MEDKYINHDEPVEEVVEEAIEEVHEVAPIKNEENWVRGPGGRWILG